MKKVKLIDLFGVKYDEMENKINEQIKKLQENGNTIIEVKPIGENLSKCVIFVVYEQN